MCYHYTNPLKARNIIQHFRRLSIGKLTIAKNLFGKDKSEVKRLRFCDLLLLFTDVVNEQLMHKLVTVDAADKSAGVIVVCDIRRVLRQDVTDDLVDRVVALFR